MVVLRTAIVVAALAVVGLLPAQAAQAAGGTGHHHRARAAYRRFTACSARRYRRPRARRACRARLRALRHRRVSNHAALQPATTVSAVSVPATTSAPAAAPAPAPVASTAPCADGDLTPDPTNLARVNAATLCLVNQVRGQHGLPALVENAKLQSAAQRHTDDMVTQSYFAHVGPAGDDPLSRMEAVGYVSNDTVGYIVGENIAWGTLTLSTPSAIVNAWVGSPEHLANILDPAYRDTGLAASAQAPPTMALGQAGAVYTQDFGGLSS